MSKPALSSHAKSVSHTIQIGSYRGKRGLKAVLNQADSVPTITGDISVGLVTMPFVSALRPSIQLGLLQSIAVSAGFSATTLHLNLSFAKQIGLAAYEALSVHRGRQFGDWLFSCAAFDADAPDQLDSLPNDFFSDLSTPLKDSGLTIDQFVAIRHAEVPAYLDRLIQEIPWDKFTVVGFSSTFQQNAASFALAKRIKQQFPHVLILFGGANFEGEMGSEWLNAVPSIDYVIRGPADTAFPQFLQAIKNKREPAAIPGVLGRNSCAPANHTVSDGIQNLDDLPTPDYDEYFERAEDLGIVPRSRRRDVFIPFESSRGCWWGEKSQCTFCGLNGTQMGFRSKSAKRVLEELSYLSRRYRSFHFEAVDNILDRVHLRTLFPQLIESASDYIFFYEVKSNLSREQIKLLRDGGVRRLQPGIESLSTHVLHLMRKGVTAIQNVNTLRWAAYYGIQVAWNLLWGFPGETGEDYREQAHLARKITHLQPPESAGRIWMERYSPIFTDRVAFPVRLMRPEKSYGYVYPSQINLDKVAYFFEYELLDALPDSAYEEIRLEVATWRSRWKTHRPTLTFWSSPQLLYIEDRRDRGNAGSYTFIDDLAALYVACSDKPCSVTQLKDSLALHWSLEDLTEALDKFCELGLMMREKNLFLSLALPNTFGR